MKWLGSMLLNQNFRIGLNLSILENLVAYFDTGVEYFHLLTPLTFVRAWSSSDFFGFEFSQLFGVRVWDGFQKIGPKLVKFSSLLVREKILTKCWPKCIISSAKISILQNWIWSGFFRFEFGFWQFSKIGFFGFGFEKIAKTCLSFWVRVNSIKL